MKKSLQALGLSAALGAGYVAGHLQSAEAKLVPRGIQVADAEKCAALAAAWDAMDPDGESLQLIKAPEGQPFCFQIQGEWEE